MAAKIGAVLLIFLACADAEAAQCTLTAGFDFTGDDLLGPNGKPAPQPSKSPADCCNLCASKLNSTEPKGKCFAWSWNNKSKTCWMKTGKGHPHKSTDVSGVVSKPTGNATLEAYLFDIADWIMDAGVGPRKNDR